jgi:hypothetical protein
MDSPEVSQRRQAQVAAAGGHMKEEVPCRLGEATTHAEGGVSAPFVVEVSARARAVGVSNLVENLDLGWEAGFPAGNL